VNLGNGKTAEPELVPPVNPKRTVHCDYIISLEDGKKYKTLRRHLGIRGLTPEAYRQKWSLAADYPMVAPGYAAARSELAKAMGLGKKTGKTKTLKRSR
jgi:predicted transcriptional regulator